MKTYPSIEYRFPKGHHVLCFDKLDGSNVRAEWSKKRGFYKFGTRKQMIDHTHPNFGKAVTIFLEKYNEDLNRIFRENYRDTDKITVFGEYFGPNSFAGNHDPNDTMDVVLFDVFLYKKSWVPPKEFLKIFTQNVHTPDLIHEGNFNQELINSIKNATELSEGVVCKGIQKTKGQDLVIMTKIKTNRWLDRLKEKYGQELVDKEGAY